MSLDRTTIVATNTQEFEDFGGTLRLRACQAGTEYGEQTDSQGAPALTFELLPGVADPILPGSLLLGWGGDTYVERDGVLYKGIDSRTNAGLAVGSVDYAARRATLSSYPAGVAPAIQVQGCLTARAGIAVTAATWRTPGAPLRPGSLQVTAVRADTGATLTASADNNGAFTGPLVWGSVDHATGIVRLRFSANPADASGQSEIPVVPGLLRYNAVLYTALPLNADLLGLDPVRLPADGRVPIYREGEVLVIHHSDEISVPSPQPGGTLDLGRPWLSAVEVFGADGRALAPGQYDSDRDAGRLTWANPLLLQDAAGEPLSLPLSVRHRVEHMATCTEVQISGVLGLSSPLPWDLPAGDTGVSSAVAWGDLQARLYRWYTQKTWNTGAPNWSDRPLGDGTTAQYNQLNYPPVVSNRGAISGQWALVFVSNSQFQIVERQLGVIGTGTTASDCAPLNPATNTPYFTIAAAGWGTGWAAGNAVRFDTDACLGPLWLVRTVLSGQGTVDDDSFRIQIRGDAD